MAFETYVYMVASAPSPSTAIREILTRLYPLDVRLETEFFELGGERRKAIPEEAGWEAKVDAWKMMHFSVASKGPVLSLTLTKLAGTTLRVTVEVSGRSLALMFADNRRHDSIFYAPLFQIALALDVRSGVGDLELEEFEPTTEKEVEQAIWRSPQDLGVPSRLGFLRRAPGTPKPNGPFVVTERPEGYWLLEHPTYLRFLGEK